MLTLDTDIAGLGASAPEPLPFAPSLHMRAFVLRRGARGDILVYDTGALPADLEVSRHYLNHAHEASFASRAVDAPRFVHAADAGPVAAAYPVRGPFSRRHGLDEDFEVIPTPGHTPGATAYLWDSGEHRFLFTGDTVLLREGEWVGAVLGSSDRDAYVESLAVLGDLDFDVLVPWAATAGDPYYAVTSRADARRRLDAIAERVRRGARG
jgi:glyoxylase-like metal-dependent hydrolase (beta-lactamase superfamily II)